MESKITLIAYNEFDIVIIIVGLTNLASHILESLIPFFWGNVHWSKPQISLTFFSITKTFSQRSIKNIELIVEGELIILFNIPKSKNTYTDLAEDIPFLGNTIRLARMVNKACQVSFFSRIYNLTFARFHEVGTSRNRILLDSSSTLIRVNGENLTNILHDEITLTNPFSSAQPPSFTSSWEGVNKCVLVLLELTIITKIVTPTRLIVALSRDHSVDTAIPAVIGDIRMFIYSKLVRKYLSGSD